MFDRQAFINGFDKTLKRLSTAEKLTKDTLRDLSRDLLFSLFESEDIQHINRTIEVLSPMNKRTAVLFFREHTAFKFDDDSGKFTSKNKKQYDDVKGKSLASLEDPHFNMWTWAEKNVALEVKPLDMAKITSWVASTLKKAQEQGINKGDVFKAMMAGGFEAEELLAILNVAADE